ncbi:MAG: hypothetical protein QOD28_8, partial [Acidobacteriota bacterium]|nr:hypothetical protein [Acidobacteriota bacterium]
VTEEEALRALHSSRLADGSAFDPASVALLEEPFDFAPQTLDAGAAARVISLSDDGRMEVETRANAPSFLVTSDVFYPGWQATIDGTPALLLRTDYALRGLAVPAGRHTIRFEFRPPSFYQGASISAASLILLAATIFQLNRKATRRAQAD